MTLGADARLGAGGAAFEENFARHGEAGASLCAYVGRGKGGPARRRLKGRLLLPAAARRKIG